MPALATAQLPNALPRPASPRFACNVCSFKWHQHAVSPPPPHPFLSPIHTLHLPRTCCKCKCRVQFRLQLRVWVQLQLHVRVLVRVGVLLTGSGPVSSSPICRSLAAAAAVFNDLVGLSHSASLSPSLLAVNVAACAYEVDIELNLDRLIVSRICHKWLVSFAVFCTASDLLQLINWRIN